MALYATLEKNLVFARDADPKIVYLCINCQSPVRVRRGKSRAPHFYHLAESSRCHLYSKSEDHHILQMQILSLFPESTLEVEKPFFEIQRIADLVWEEKKIIFEIQCSKIEPWEAKQRIIDYKRFGYDIVWLLDDRMFNKRVMRPSETFLRDHTSYFFSFFRDGTSVFYDQCEVIVEKERRKKGFRTKVNLLAPEKQPNINWPDKLPSQVYRRIEKSLFYFKGDILYRIIQSFTYTHLIIPFYHFREEEISLEKSKRAPSQLRLFFKEYFYDPFNYFLDGLIADL